MLATYLKGGSSVRAEFVSASAAVGGSSSLSPSLPDGTAIGDVVFIYCANRNGLNRWNTPTDWELLEETTSHSVFARRRDSEWSMPTLTYTGNIAQSVAQAVAIRGLLNISTVESILVAEAEVTGTQQDMPIPALTISSGSNLFVICFATKAATSVADGFSVSDLDAPSPWTVGSAGKGINGTSLICATFYVQQVGAATNISSDTALIVADQDESLFCRSSIFAFQTSG